MNYYRIENCDYIDDNKFKTLSQAKSHVRDNFTPKEREKMFNDHATAKIMHYDDKKDGSFEIVSETPFYCDEFGSHFGRTKNL